MAKKIPDKIWIIKQIPAEDPKLQAYVKFKGVG
jgi:hypothetical protein